jgi:hypothetical protein
LQQWLKEPFELIKAGWPPNMTILPASLYWFRAFFDAS